MPLCGKQAIDGDSNAVKRADQVFFRVPGTGPRAAGTLDKWGRLTGLMAALVILSAIALPSAAQLLEKRITPLNPLDRQYMDTQRDLINEMTLRYYGGRCCRDVSELDYLQRLLDDGYVGGDQTRELQAMGVLLGDLLAAELELQWIVYEDAQGRSRALQLDDTDNFLFPVTMISRRREADDRTPVIDIYRAGVDAIEAVRPPLPFQ